MIRLVSGVLFCVCLLAGNFCFGFDLTGCGSPYHGKGNSAPNSFDGAAGQPLFQPVEGPPGPGPLNHGPYGAGQRHHGGTKIFDLGPVLGGAVRHGLAGDELWVENGGETIYGTANTLGNTTYYDFDNGVSGTGTRLGNTTYYDFDNGVSGTATDIGGTTFYDFTDSEGRPVPDF